MALIGIHGRMRSGKDTIAQIVIDTVPSFERRAFADKVKQIGANILNVPLEWMYDEERKNQHLDTWGMTLGRALQLIGTDALREKFHREVWVLTTLGDYDPALHNVVIPDVRFPNEARAVRERGGLLIKTVGDPSGMAAKSTRDPNHSSETSLDSWDDWDYIIYNDGTLAELQQKVHAILAREGLI